MQIMQQTLPQREAMFANIYQYVHETFLNDSLSRFGYTTVREAKIPDDKSVLGHW